MAKMNRGPKGALGKIMKQAQAAQARMAAVEEELGGREYLGSAGGGVVEVVVNGRHELKSVKIDPQVVRQDEVEMLEDLVLAAANDAHRQAEAAAKAEMEKASGGFDLEGMF